MILGLVRRAGSEADDVGTVDPILDAVEEVIGEVASVL
jgi:hypothetical protein